MSASIEALEVLARLWHRAGEDQAALEGVRLTGGDPVLPGNFKVGTAAMASIAAAELAAAELWRMRTGRRQSVAVDARAAASAFRGERYLRVDGRKPPDPCGAISGFHRAGDGRWIQLHCNFPHHLEGTLRVLASAGTREAVAAAITGWKAAELEDALAAAGMCAGMVRTPEEWQRHQHGQGVGTLPLLEILKGGRRSGRAVWGGRSAAVRRACPRSDARHRGAGLWPDARRARSRRAPRHRRAPAEHRRADHGHGPRQAFRASGSASRGSHGAPAVTSGPGASGGGSTAWSSP